MLGLMMIMLSLSMLFLLITKFPNVRRNSFPIDNPLKVPTGANNPFNITLQPNGKNDYMVEVTVSPVKGPIYLDLWVVNSTWIGPFLSLMDWVFSEYGQQFREDYPEGKAFKIIPAYAKEINITGLRYIKLRVDHDDVYCFVFINFFAVTQYVSVSVEEKYLDPIYPYRSILEPNLVNFSITFALSFFGAYLVIKDRKKKRFRKLRGYEKVRAYATKRQYLMGDF